MTNRWQKILADTHGITKLSPTQRYWRAIALLRMGRTPEAESLITRGGPHFLNKLEHRIAYAEVLCSVGKEKESVSLLEQCYGEACSTPESLRSWEYCVSRLKNPSERLVNQRKRIMDSPQTPPAPQSTEEWKRFLSLRQFRHSFDQYLAWLSWSVTHNRPPQELQEILTTTLQECSVSSYHMHQLVSQVSTVPEMWPFLISTLFTPATKLNKKPSLMWKSWWKRCPTPLQAQLHSAMKSYLARTPSLELEQTLQRLTPSRP